MITGSRNVALCILSDGTFGLYEPAGGSAPDIAGKGIVTTSSDFICCNDVNSFALMRLTQGLKSIEKFWNRGIEQILCLLAKQVGTAEMGDLICRISDKIILKPLNPGLNLLLQHFHSHFTSFFKEGFSFFVLAFFHHFHAFIKKVVYFSVSH